MSDWHNLCQTVMQKNWMISLARIFCRSYWNLPKRLFSHFHLQIAHLQTDQQLDFQIVRLCQQSMRLNFSRERIFLMRFGTKKTPKMINFTRLYGLVFWDYKFGRRKITWKAYYLIRISHCDKFKVGQIQAGSRDGFLQFFKTLKFNVVCTRRSRD